MAPAYRDPGLPLWQAGEWFQLMAQIPRSGA